MNLIDKRFLKLLPKVVLTYYLKYMHSMYMKSSTNFRDH